MTNNVGIVVVALLVRKRKKSRDILWMTFGEYKLIL